MQRNFTFPRRIVRAARASTASDPCRIVPKSTRSVHERPRCVINQECVMRLPPCSTPGKLLAYFTKYALYFPPLSCIVSAIKPHFFLPLLSRFSRTLVSLRFLQKRMHASHKEIYVMHINMLQTSRVHVRCAAPQAALLPKKAFARCSKSLVVLRCLSTADCRRTPSWGAAGPFLTNSCRG